MTTTTNRPTEAATILERSVCLTLSCSYLGNDRKVDNASVVAAAHGTEALDARAVRATVKLVDQKELRGPNRIIGEAKSRLARMSIAAHRIFGERSYLIPIALVGAVDAMLQAAQLELEVEARLVGARYARLVEEQRQRLGPLFNPRSYPSERDVAEAWGIDWQYVSFAAPERLETVDRAVYESSVRKWDAKLGEAYAEVRDALRTELRWFTAEFARRLTPTEAGTVKVVHGRTLLRDLREFLDTFEMRNITDDADVAAVVEDVRRLTYGYEGRELNNNAAVRAELRASMEEATARLDGMITTGRRGIRLGGPAPENVAA